MSPGERTDNKEEGGPSVNAKSGSKAKKRKRRAPPPFGAPKGGHRMTGAELDNMVRRQRGGNSNTRYFAGGL